MSNTHYQLPIDSIPPWTRILLPESHDIRVIVAAVTLKLAWIIDPVLIWDRSAVDALFADISARNKYSLTDATDVERHTLSRIEILPHDTSVAEEYAELYASKKSITTDEAKTYFPEDISQAAHILKTWWVDGVLKHNFPCLRCSRNIIKA